MFSLNIAIPAATIDTCEPDRNTHLKSADFFDVEKFPTLSFKSTSVTRRPDDELEVEGDLTIHGVTRKVRLAVEGPTAEGKASDDSHLLPYCEASTSNRGGRRWPSLPTPSFVLTFPFTTC
jgi:polyisoprenoid-binding protein YceI